MPPHPKTEHRELPFHAWRSHPRVMPWAHVHTDIELNLFLCGRGRYFFAGRFSEMTPDRLSVFWAGIPHRLLDVDPGTEYLCMTLPLAWFLSWGMDSGFVDRLLSGEMIEAQAADGEGDRLLFQRWGDDLKDPESRRNGEARRIVLLEVEARLRRLARGGGSAPTPPSGAVRGDPVERIAAHLSRCYSDPELSVESVAAAAELHPGYAMTVFKKGCGATIWDYLTRLRLSHAQRLLITTDWTVERVAWECGFASMSRFYALFRARSGCSPRAYRKGGYSD